MAARRTPLLLVLAVLALLVAQAPAALAGGDPDNPRVTLFEADSDAADVRRGRLYVRARCDTRCVIDVRAFARISGKRREIAFTRQTLRGGTVRRIRLEIRSSVRRRVASGARFSYKADAMPAPMG